jgi:hypothetical protein
MAPAAAAARRSPYIVSAAYDWSLFLGPPLGALLLGIAIAGSPLSADRLWIGDGPESLATLGIGIFIHAHLVLVFARSHANEHIFKLYPARFVAVPFVLYIAMMSSSWILITASVIATFWDVYHSALQTFGFGRIYDAKAGNPPDIGRRLDWWMNQLLYCGPILAGATMIDHFDTFAEYEKIDSSLAAALVQVPGFMLSEHSTVAGFVLGAGTAFVAYYVYAYRRLAQQGYHTSPQKVYLLASTGLCSIYTWGFNSFGQAFFIMNFFHALQYFGIVWAMENKNMAQRLNVAHWPHARTVTVATMLVLTLAYGTAVQLYAGDDRTWFLAITLVVSLMHFWYDGFVWSVRRSQV